MRWAGVSVVANGWVPMYHILNSNSNSSTGKNC